jgi:hypothetical protein
MIITASPSDQDIFLALATFLRSVLPSGSAIFTASIDSTVMTVSSIDTGALQVGDAVLGDNIVPGTAIAAFGTGTGGAGTYIVVPDQGATGDPANPSVPSTVVSSGVEVIQGQVDRVPEPKESDYITMVMLRFPRLSTNADAYQDCKFTASIAGAVMTVSAVAAGTLKQGLSVFGLGVQALTTIRGYAGGSGGPGAYLVSPAQTVTSETMSAGSKTVTESVQWTVQLDLHGPNSGNFAQIVSALFRDEMATDAFAAINPAITPLYADEPRQMPFTNAEQNYEGRYVLEVNLQVDQTISIAQQFADTVTIGLYNVDQPPAS